MTLSLFETRLSRAKPKPMADRRSCGNNNNKIEPDYSRLRELGCKGCPLYSEHLQHPKMKPTGSKRPVIYVLGEAPGETEDERGEQFIGRSGQLLRKALDTDMPIRWNNCCRRRPPNNRAPARVEWERCRRSVEQDIVESKPAVVLAVGAVALQWAIGETTITKWRGKWAPIVIEGRSLWIYPILHPSFVLRASNYAEEDWELVFRADLRALVAQIDVGGPDPQVEPPGAAGRDICYARDAGGLARLAQQIARWDEHKTVVAFDIETAGLRPYGYLPASMGWLSIAMSDGDHTWAVPISHRESMWSPDDQKEARAVVETLLRSKGIVKVAHNLPFELEWLTLIYGHKRRWRRTGWGDTMVQAYVLDERKGVLSLDHCCLHRFGIHLKQQIGMDRGKLAESPIGKLLEYNALDALYTAKLYHVQREEIEWEGLSDVYRLHMRRPLTLVKAQQRGLVLDFDAVDRFRAKLGKKIARARKAILASDEAVLYREKTGKELSPTSPPQVTVLFRNVLRRSEGARDKNKSGYSVDDESLSAMDLPVASDILALRKLLKIKGTYLDEFTRTGKLIHADGRLHAKFNDLFTATGRLSSDSPNMQNFPKREDAWVRAIVTTPKTHPLTGQSCPHVIVSADYGQIEYRVIGIAADDAYIKKTLKERYDVHLDWAERVAKAAPHVYRRYGKDIKKLRSEIKNAMVFPAFYGASPDKIAGYLGLGKRTAHGLFDEFWEEFAGVRKWQQRLWKQYQKDGYVECLTGRRRRAPLTRNMVLNSPIQGSASDIVVDAMNRLSVRADKEKEPAFQAVLNVHDDLTFYVPVDRQEELTAEIVHEMLAPSFDWVTVPLSVEVLVGENWAAMKNVGTYYSDG